MPLVKVKRDGPRGWHLIDADKYNANPSAFELVVDVPPAPLDAQVPPPPPAGPVDPLANLADDWRTHSAPDLRKLAEVISGRTAANKGEAIAVIEAAIAAKAAPPAAPVLPPPPPPA